MYSNKWYDDSATEAKFLLGGIGAGNVSVGVRGNLCDWELFDRSGIGYSIPYSFFAIRTETQNKDIKIRILESKLRPPFERSHGYSASEAAGIPRFEHSRLCGEISRAVIELQDNKMPVDVQMTAFSPFIPLNADDSGIPSAVIRYSVFNKTDENIRVSIAGCCSNVSGFSGYSSFNALKTEGTLINQYIESDGLKGLYFSGDLPDNHLRYGNLALATTSAENVSVKPEWLLSGWLDGAHDFWDDFIEDGKLEPVFPREKYVSAIQSDDATIRTGSLCIDFTIPSKKKKEIEFILSWYFPNMYQDWGGTIFPKVENPGIIKKYYSNLFKDAWDVSKYLSKHMASLEGQTISFIKAFYSTTLPREMLDAMAANISVLRSHTCFRLQDGAFLGWEGGFNHGGSCEGNCSHVWNYQQTCAFLFPELEQSMRRTNFLLETEEDGEMNYRSNRVMGHSSYKGLPPACDGQMGTIIQLYRDWKLSGDDAFLKEVKDSAFRALDFAFTNWDEDGDFVFDAMQHNTYDIEFYGSNSMTNSIFYAALKAAAEMAEYLGEEERAEKYRKAFDMGSRKMDSLLYNGEYYIQKLEDDGKYQYQYYDGCLSDQLLGQELAHISGLGYILPKDHVESALMSVYNYNFRENLSEHINIQRTFALDDEGGLITCSWPHGHKPLVPFVYSDEVWTGIEYQVATHLIYEGHFEEALTIVKTLRSRYDGIRRNPWNEVECGNHYVRAMASWGLLLAASGYRFDLCKNEISFDPCYSQDNFSCFFSNAKCWGIFHQKKDPETGKLVKELNILYGDSNVHLS